MRARTEPRVLVVLKRMVKGLFAHNAFEASASIAFWFFLSLVPLLVVAGWLLGHVVQSQGIDTLLSPAFDLAPGSAEGLLRAEIDRMARAASPAAPIGIIGFLWTSSSGLHNLMDIFEIAVQAERRPWWKQRLLALGWVLVGLLAVVATAWLIVQIDSTRGPDEPATTVAAPLGSLERAAGAAAGPSSAPAARGRPAASATRPSPPKPGLARAIHLRNPAAAILRSPWQRALVVLVMLGLGTTILAGFYRFAVEHHSGIKRRYWPGALVAVATWLLVSWAFGEYVRSLANYAVYYGGLAAVAVLLVWLYLTSLTLVVGAEVNAQLEGVRR
jgi:membrane protein